MSPLLVALLGVLLIPLFVATWRTSLLGLAAQGVLMAMIFSGSTSDGGGPSYWLNMVDLLVVRGIAAPLALYAVLRAKGAESRNDVIPPNLVSWTLALGIVLVAFVFAEHLVPDVGDEQTLIAVSAAALLLGFLVLATQSAPFSQIVGVLRIENAIALFEVSGELGGDAGQLLGVQLGQILVVMVSIALYRWYLQVLSSDPENEGREGPTL